MIIAKCPVCKFTLTKPNNCEILKIDNLFKEECQSCNYIFIFDRNQLHSIVHKNVFVSKNTYINDGKLTIINLNSKYINTEEMYNHFNSIFYKKFKKHKLNSYKEICLLIKKINDNLIFE